MAGSGLDSDPLRGLGGLDQGAFDALRDTVFGVLCWDDGASEADLKTNAALGSTDAADVKRLYAGLCALVLEHARGDSPAALVAGALEEAGLDGGAAETFGEQFAARKARLRDVLATTGFSLPHIVDVDWRLDYHVRSSVTGRATEPIYLLRLRLKNAQGEYEDVEFCCNPSQLQDLLARVRDATKQVERITTALSG